MSFPESVILNISVFNWLYLLPWRTTLHKKITTFLEIFTSGTLIFQFYDNINKNIKKLSLKENQNYQSKYE